MQAKLCNSCGKDYPSETNKFCPECFETEKQAKEYLTCEYCENKELCDLCGGENDIN